MSCIEGKRGSKSIHCIAKLCGNCFSIIKSILCEVRVRQKNEVHIKCIIKMVSDASTESDHMFIPDIIIEIRRKNEATLQHLLA